MRASTEQGAASELRVASAEDRTGPWRNRLAEASSRYLREHGDNPVDWHPWGDEPFALARELNRPVFLSMGYASCHWCHVMERESFRDPSIAAYLNTHFVSIKVDREEHPDVDAVYIDALLAMTGAAGWPASLFLTTEGAPFYGGTYFPPTFRYGMLGFRSLLEQVHSSWTDGRSGVDNVVARIREGMAAQGTHRSDLGAAAVPTAIDRLIDGYNEAIGGWDHGPRFPQPPRIALLLLAQALGIRAEEAGRISAHLLQTIDRSGVHDHLAGGFHRYAVDEDWRVPHFEKMLYDNAQLLSVYLDAWVLHQEDRFATVAARTAEYLLDRMRGDHGLFCASEDADDPGGEGAHYTWTPEQLSDVLGPRAQAAAQALGVSPMGNHENGGSVLYLAGDPGVVSAVRGPLLAARDRRPAPPRDDKAVVGWNGMAIEGLARAGMRLADRRYLDAAAHAADWILDRRQRPLRRTLNRDGALGILDDHALLGAGLLCLFEATGEARWLLGASELGQEILAACVDPGTKRLVQARRDGPQLFSARYPWMDGAEPSGTGTALLLLVRLAGLGDETLDENRLADLLSAARGAIVPEGAPTIVRALALYERGVRTVVVRGGPGDPIAQALCKVAWRSGDPGLIVAPMLPGVSLGDRFHAFSGKEGAGKEGGGALAWLCEGRSCRVPTDDPATLAAALALTPQTG